MEVEYKEVSYVEEPKATGRPRTPVDHQLIYKLAAIHCSNREIASVVGIHIDSLQRMYGDLIRAGREAGKSKLRRRMWEEAMKGNVTMMIWLSKNYMGMTDAVVVSEDKQPLPWSDEEEQKIDEQESTPDNIVVEYTEIREDLDALAEDLAKI